ncbi:LamG-like jellyroll fold domain-containing protein [Flagellimonas sp.]|uniref:LamG-like jellyroll fold domain-containing protein n=1 Tax=Flagellimonas sp. TaxID=2058762 RepID=UPI003B5BC8C1
MNRRINILCLIILGSISLNGQTTDHSNFLNGLVSAYSMESSTILTDELGTNNGTVNGASLVTGNLGNALNFTGSQATMGVVPTSSSLDLNGAEMTLMVDIYPTANGQSGYSVIFQKGVGATGDNIYSISYKSNNTVRFRNYVNGVRRDFISTTVAPLNTWSRIICVWKSGEAKIIRINSATDVDASIYSGTQDVSADRDLTIGSYDLAGPAAARSFLGNIDNAMIWNRALTTAEQNTLINENLGFSDFNAGSSDTQNPTAPTLSSTGQTDTTVNLSWSGATDNVGVTGYKIFKDNNLEATLGNVNTYQVAGLTESTSYNFTATALDAAGNESSTSNSISVSTNAGSGGGGSNGSSVWSETNSVASYSGDVGIGTNAVPSGYKLAVEGKIRTREIRVDQDTWPDYVFKEGYDLPSLEEIQKHIEEKGHLPNIPSAKEVEANGVELGEMNKLLLEKVEELTLYILELTNENKEIKKRLALVEKNNKQ